MSHAGRGSSTRSLGARLRPAPPPAPPRPYPGDPFQLCACRGVTLNHCPSLGTGPPASLPSRLRHESAGSCSGCAVPGRGRHPTGPLRGAWETGCSWTPPGCSGPEWRWPGGVAGRSRGAFCRPPGAAAPAGPPRASRALPASPVFYCLTPGPLRTIGFPGDHWAVGHTDLAGIPALPGHVTASGEGPPAPVST